MLGPQELYERAVGHANEARFGSALRLLDLAERRSPDPDLAALVAGTRAYVVASRGNPARAADLCRAALTSPGISPLTAAIVAGQLGLVLIHAGDFTAAASTLDRAAAGLDGEPRHLGNVLLNRGMLALEAEDLDRAEVSFERASLAFDAADLPVGAAKARHNLAVVAQARGDLVRARRELESARGVLAPLGPVMSAWSDLALADLMLAAGMPREAIPMLQDAAAAFGRARMRRQQAEAELLVAQTVSPLAPGDAIAAARRAVRHFTGAEDPVGRLHAQAALLQLRLAGFPRRVDLQQSEAVAVELAEHGLRDSARALRRHRARALAVRGDVARARAELTRVRPAPGESLTARVLHHEVAAEVATVAGRRREALRQARAGVSLVEDWQARYEDLDLRTSLAVHTRRLLGIGIENVLERGDATDVLAWSELTRGVISRAAPVRRPAVAEASTPRAVERAPEDRTGTGPRLRPTTPWRERDGEVHDGESRLLDLAHLREVLAAEDAALVSYVRTDSVLAAVVVDPTDVRAPARLVRLAAWSDVAEPLRALLADLDMAAARLPDTMARVVRSSLRHRLDLIGRLLVAPLGLHSLHRVVVTAPPAISGIPWPLLPGLEGTAVSVAETARDWMRRARTGTSGDPAVGVGVGVGAGAGAAAGPRADTPAAALVAGPRLAHAVAEVTRAAEAWGATGRTLTGGEATVSAVSAVASEVDVLHIAAHGRHSAGNPLFSGFELVDGPWFGYDIELLEHVPSVVILSSCELGRSSAVWGQETVGMARAWLHAGVRCVVAAPARVPDAAAGVVVELHRALARGEHPAHALARLAPHDGADLVPAAAYVCFGNGW